MARNYVTTVRSNDTLQSIANRFTKDPNRWTEIVVANPHLPKKTKLVNGRPVSVISNLFVGQNLVLPSYWFNNPTTCPPGYILDGSSMTCIPTGTTVGTIGCGSSCTAEQIKNGTCKDFNLKQFMGVSGPPSDGSLGCGGGGHHGCGSCNNNESNGCGYPFGPGQPGPVGNGCSSCGFDYLCDYPFGNGGSLCPMPYGAFGGGPKGVVNGPPEGQLDGCGSCGRSRGEFYLQGTVGDAVDQAQMPTQQELMAALQKFIDMSPADCEKESAKSIGPIITSIKASPQAKQIYDALVKKYGSEEELNSRILIMQQTACGEPLKNVNVQAPYKTNTGLLWLGGTLVGGIIAGVVAAKVL